MFWEHLPYLTNIASDWLRAELSCGRRRNKNKNGWQCRWVFHSLQREFVYLLRLTQTAASYSFPNIPPFYPNLIVPSSSSLAVACCVHLPACWLCVHTAVGLIVCPPGCWTDCVSTWSLDWMYVQMSVGLNDWRYHVVLLYYAILNLSLLKVLWACRQIQLLVCLIGQNCLLKEFSVPAIV